MIHNVLVSNMPTLTNNIVLYEQMSMNVCWIMCVLNMAFVIILRDPLFVCVIMATVLMEQHV